MRLYKLNKTVLLVNNNAAQFLNGLTANSLDKPNNAFLTIHGRIIATFDQLRLGEDEFLLLIDQPFVKEVLQHVERYARLSKTKIEPQPYAVFFDLDGQYLLQAGEWAVAQKAGKIVVTPRELNENLVSSAEFDLFRVTHQLPWLGIDFQKDEFLLNVSDVEFISFTKGCFLGQEPVAKVHNRSRPSKRLAVKYADECSDEERAQLTSAVVEPSSGRAKGFVFVKNV